MSVVTKVEPSEAYVVHEVDSSATDECVFFKKVDVTRGNDWVWYDLPKGIIPVAVRINGSLTQFDWDATVIPSAGIQYDTFGKQTVLSEIYNVTAGKTQNFDLTVDNLNEQSNEPAKKIGHYFHSRNNGNTCYIRVYKWIEKKVVEPVQYAKDGYLNTPAGPKQIKAAVLNTENGPKVIFGRL